jgi:hypothetical protein
MNIEWGYLRTECWGAYLDLYVKKKDREENCTMMNFTACILHRIVPRWLIQGGWGGLDMWNAWGSGNVFTWFWSAGPKVKVQGMDHAEVSLEKLIIAQLVNKSPFFYGTLKFITLFPPTRYWSLSWATYIHSTSSRPIFLRVILILSSLLRLGLSCRFLPFWFIDQNFVRISHFSYANYMPVNLILLDFIIITFDKVYNLLKLLIMKSFPVSYYFVS